MPLKPMLHGCYDIHVKKEKRKPRYTNTQVGVGRYGAPAWQSSDYTLCGVDSAAAWWRRKPVKISESLCPRTVTCKRCAASINKYKRINNKPK